MPYLVTIRKNATGEVRQYRDEFDWEPDGSSDFYWSEGNNGCDGNRAQLFARVKNETAPEHICGTTEYTVRITDLNGEELYADDDWGKVDICQ